MKRSPQLEAIISSIPKDFADPAADYLAVRDVFDSVHGHPVSDDVHVEIATFGDVRCGVYTIDGAANHPTVLHCHGGALVSSPIDIYHFYGEMIARHTGCRVIMVDYRLAPEHPYPAAHDDCFNAYRGLLESGVDPAHIVITGESCGGSLGLGAIIRARDEGLALPACFVSLTGWFDLSVAGDTVPGDDPFLTPEWVRNRGKDYIQDQFPLDDPRVSPCYADPRGLPPLYLQIGEFDKVREGAILLANNALRGGVCVVMESWPGMIQGWQGLINAKVPEAEAAWQNIRRYIEQTCIIQGAVE